MTDYNDAEWHDGEWHTWNGKGCPVHPLSHVEMIWIVPVSKVPIQEEKFAKDFEWGRDGYCDKCLFRVTKPYVEPRKPREIWVNEYDDGLGALHETKESADKYFHHKRIRCIHFIEGIEE